MSAHEPKSLLWRLKACPRCGGDLYAEREKGRLSWRCLQCGFDAVAAARRGELSQAAKGLAW